MWTTLYDRLIGAKKINGILRNEYEKYQTLAKTLTGDFEIPLEQKFQR